MTATQKYHRFGRPYGHQPDSQGGPIRASPLVKFLIFLLTITTEERREIWGQLNFGRI